MSLKAAVSERFGELRAVRWRESADSPAEFAGSIERRDRFSEGVEDARLGIATRSAVRRRAPRIDGYAVIRWLIDRRSEEHTSELQSLMRISYAVFCLKKKKKL